MSVEFIEASRIVSMLKTLPDSIAVIDVREADYSVLIIKETSLERIRQATMGKTYVVFHCHYSQTRGPAAAELYLRYLIEKQPDKCHPHIYILHGGFKTFRQLYKDDPAVYEAL